MESSILASRPSHVVDQCPVCVFTKFSVVHTKGHCMVEIVRQYAYVLFIAHNGGVVYLNPCLSDEILSAFYAGE